jgi:hypothetical protein
MGNMKGVASMQVLLTITVFCALMMPAHGADGAFWESGNDFLRYCSSVEKDDVIDLIEVTRGHALYGLHPGTVGRRR